MFKIDVSESVPLRYKYIYLNCLYTCGELSGKLLHLFCKLRERKMLFWGVLVRICAAVAIYAVSDVSKVFWNLENVMFLKSLACVFQGLSIGYVFNMILDIGQLHFKGRPYDALKYGQIFQYFVQFGALLGSITSSVF